MKQYYKTSVHSRSYPANSEPPFHKVTHRHDKSIPGCKMLESDGRYTGVFPSAEVCAFVNSLKEKMKFFDDGRRMQYGKLERVTEVERCDVIHPITYPPAGFVLRDDQWVYED